MTPGGHHVWRLSGEGTHGLGVSCTADGLYLGRTPLVERCGRVYVVRPETDLERLFNRAYGTGISRKRFAAGLARVASALSQRNLPLAQIAALHLRLPDLTDAGAELALQAEDSLIRRERSAGGIARTTWNDDRHPRTGTPPNPGWFAPKPGSAEHPRPMRTAQRGRGEREAAESLDPQGPVRQALWDARIARLRQIDPDNPNLTYFANPESPPSQEALNRVDAEVSAAAARIANRIANGHAFASHAAEFPEMSSQPEFARVIERVISSRSSLVRSLRDGRTAFYEQSTNTLVIVNPNASDLGTAFRPQRRIDYVNELE